MWEGLHTWQQLVIIRNTKEEGQVVAHVAALRIDKDVPAEYHPSAPLEYIIQKDLAQQPQLSSVLTICSFPLQRWCFEALFC